ncbi:MAG: type II toxin-antitoxin system HicB family antitoxin [Oscillibacter sp.]|nr:type II toxin-antitoxin system HicB family antitoxin [Oscillibacter sp.]
MKKPDRYIFPAIFTYETGQEIAVVFPDLNCATSGVDDADALLSARELLGGYLALLEEDGEEIPAPTPLSEVKVEENERSALVDVFMPSIRMAAVTKSINRTVSLPAWLNAAALEKNVNFSQILQDALKATLGVQAPVAD